MVLGDYWYFFVIIIFVYYDFFLFVIVFNFVILEVEYFWMFVEVDSELIVGNWELLKYENYDIVIKFGSNVLILWLIIILRVLVLEYLWKLWI